jgi:hypothetical protein
VPEGNLAVGDIERQVTPGERRGGEDFAIARLVGWLTRLA